MFRICSRLIGCQRKVVHFGYSTIRSFSNLEDKFNNDNPLRTILRSKATTSQRVRYDAIFDEYNELRQIQAQNDPNLESLILADLQKLNRRMDELVQEIIQDITCDEFSEIDEIVVQLTPGVGGQESMLFARELFQIYLRYFKYNNWLLCSVEDDFSEIGGLKSASVTVRGKNCFRLMRHEAGTHRIQRVPSTEKHGRIHTSTAAISILPIKHTEIVIKPSEIKIDYTTSSAPGGQNVNRNETCVRVTHLPTNIQVVSQETRSQDSNRKAAMDRLKNILKQKANQKYFEERMKLKRNQIGDMGRYDKVRTYNVPQNRITDHRLNESIYNITEFMRGDPERLHEIILKLEEKRQQLMLKKILSDLDKIK